MISLQEYFKEISEEYKRGQTTELTFRSYLKKFCEFLFPELTLSEENQQIKKIGRPDFTCFKNKIKIGYIETKDIGIDLDKELNGEQLKKYSEGAIPNIILTDYVRFILYKNQEAVLDIKLFDTEDLKKGKATFNEEDARRFKQLLESFLSYKLPTIKNASELAIELSKRAKLLRDLSKDQLEDDLQKAKEEEKSSIFDFYEAFKELIKDANVDECIDAYSQTITYGLFLSKIGSHDGLNRDSAYTYIPSSIKIIKKIFNNITGDELPSNLSWIVDEIIDILNSADINKILSEFIFEGKNYRDPFIHFYEDFLKEYDPEKRKRMGVYYTPEPVVSFITNSINEILKKEFGKSKGFADDSVKSLDFATGTGTFLANSFVLALHEIRTKGLAGIEKDKIKNHLLKDFYGFEILVSPYVIAHLKLAILLKKEGYDLQTNERVQVYLTNTVDPTETIESLVGFMKELTHETMTANAVKLKTKILVVMGNPPYSVSSSNKSEWITKLMNDYKEDLKERNMQPLDDDYIKFIRFAQWKIEETEKGIIGIITNNSYLDGLIHRVMRNKLIKTFDKMYILNLHGDSDRKDPDENVFDIKKGVSIALFVKFNKPLKDKEIYYFSTLEKGIISRADKYKFLLDARIEKIAWEKLNPKKPDYWLVKKDLSFKKIYKKGWGLTEIFDHYNSGIKSANDDFFIDFENDILTNRIKDALKDRDEETVLNKYKLKSTTGWSFKKFRQCSFDEKYISEIHYRPFDIRWIYYDPQAISRARYDTMQHFLIGENLGLISVRQYSENKIFNHVFVTDKLVDIRITLSSRGTGFVFPLYIYNDEIKTKQTSLSGKVTEKSGKQPNFTEEFLSYIKEKYPKKEISPEEILNYIYAVLHSPAYRKKYCNFLKTDFSRIPFVKKYDTFTKLSELGRKLIELHLMKTDFSKNMAKFEVSGSNEVNFVKFKDDKVFINDKQYFDGITNDVWDFYIGGYRVLDKWLKSRKGRRLTSGEIENFIKIIGIISQTIEIMEKINKVNLK
jgi:predicted helicase